MKEQGLLYSVSSQDSSRRHAEQSHSQYGVSLSALSASLPWNLLDVFFAYTLLVCLDKTTFLAHCC